MLFSALSSPALALAIPGILAEVAATRGRTIGPIEVTVEDGRVAWLQGNPHDKALGASLCAGCDGFHGRVSRCAFALATAALRAAITRRRSCATGWRNASRRTASALT